MSNNHSTEERIRGQVIEALPNAKFRIRLEGEENVEIVGYLAGKMKLYRIRVLPGDTVEIVPDAYGGQSNRIVKRC